MLVMYSRRDLSSSGESGRASGEEDWSPKAVNGRAKRREKGVELWNEQTFRFVASWIAGRWVSQADVSLQSASLER